MVLFVPALIIGTGSRTMSARIHHVIAIFIALVGVVGLTGIRLAGGKGSALDLSQYETTFSEDFDSLDVSARGPGSRWIAHTPYNGDFGDAAFADPAPGFPFSVDNGILRIEARKTANGKWRSGLLASVDAKGNGFAQKFGYFEMRARLPAGDGVWPAFWLLGAKRDTHQAEIDVMEFYGHAPAEYLATVHDWNLNDAAQSQTAIARIPVKPGELSDGFHTYGAKVDANAIHFFFDRREVGTLPAYADFAQPMYLLVDLGLGGGWPFDRAPNPFFMYVDYVRAWQQKQ
jgi:beta-glucanase (GH16 family)